MSDLKHIAVVDIGKTNVKLALVQADTWDEIAIRKSANTVLTGGVYPHYDVDGIWAFLLQSLRDLQAKHGIDAISVTTHGATAALLDQAGGLAMPILDYEHDGPDQTRQSYDVMRPGFDQTGSPNLPVGLNIGAQLHWLETCFPTEFARVQTILMYPQYWAYRLSGVAANEVTSLGCHSDLWWPSNGTYSALVTAHGWAEKMAPLRSAFDDLGPVLPKIAAETGLPETVRVFCGLHDSNASLLPYVLQDERPLCVVSTGTWVIVMGLGLPAVVLDPKQDTLVNVDAFGGPVPTARFMGGREFEQLLNGEVSTPTEAEQQSAQNSGITIVPPSGEQPSRWSQNPQNLSKGEKTALVSVYLAQETAKRLRLIGAKGPIYVEGPFAANQLYRTHLAWLSKRPVLGEVGASTGTSAGAAMLAVKTPKTLKA